MYIQVCVPTLSDECMFSIASPVVVSFKLTNAQ